MRSPTDALRSLKKYMADSLGAEWEVRLTGEEGAFHRPFARVGPAAGFRTRNLGAYRAELVQPFSIVCHPVEKNTPDETMLEAARVQHLLVLAFNVGTHTPSYRVAASYATSPTEAVNVYRAHPARIPIYNYDGVGLAQAVGSTARDHRDFMRVSGDVTVDVVPDPNDELRVAVAAAVTMSWALSAAVASPAMTVRTVTAEGEGS